MVEREEFNAHMKTLNTTISKLFDKQDEHVEKLNEVRLAMVAVETKLESLIIPTQPCKELEEHLQEHKNNETLWKKPIVNSIIGAIFVFVGFTAKGFLEWLKART